uniref:Uncharacterized protein n=1 Tax=Rhinolophus ferrumequinum TaxID=59479 RepID=A0A671DN38_RHIFE
MVELVGNRTKQVDSHMEHFETQQEPARISLRTRQSRRQKSPTTRGPGNSATIRNQEHAANNYGHDDITSRMPKEKKAKNSKGKKCSKAKAEREASPTDLPIDPYEPTYCLCNQVSNGEMISCDNEYPIQWFHFFYYCPKCQGENKKTTDKALEKSRKERAYNRK